MKKKRMIVAALTIFLISGVTVAIQAQKKPTTDFEQVAKSVENALGEDCKKQSMTELGATITYGNEGGDKILYHILKTTFYEADPDDITGLHTEAVSVLFEPELADSCEEMMIQDWYAALYKFENKAYLCWTYSPEVSYALEYNPNTFDDAEILKMAESAEVAE